MNSQQARALVEETFPKEFDKIRFHQFAKELLNGFNDDKSQTMQVPDAYAPHVRSCARLGTYEAPDGELADVLIVHTTEPWKLERTRTALRDFVAHKLKRGDSYKEAGLVAFVAPDARSWRFSFVRMEYDSKRNPKTGKIAVEERLTPARRFSYIVGKNESCHTAQSRFLELLQDTDNKPTLEQIEDAFSVEAVTKEFFEQYKGLFLNLKDELDAIAKKDKAIGAEFTEKKVSTADFAKKLMGQIVFLYFLQKKGWLGVEKGGDWGDGAHNFLRQLFAGKFGSYKNFFNDILEPLFYDTLATDRGHEAWCSIFKCRIPFLNGGLFEPVAGYDWKKTDINIPNSLFSNSKTTEAGDEGTGILDVFDRYNFTVNEAEPLEKEVAIDPEMLGKVFENLLEVKERKSKGSFYTPREIVHYMCQESLINYLDTAINSKTELVGTERRKQGLLGDEKAEQALLTVPTRGELIPRADIEDWIHKSDQYANFAEAIASGTKGEHYPKPAKTVIDNAKLLDEKLEEIAVCDPAIGSGAFPVGMMQEIVRARSALTHYFNDPRERSAYQFKRHAIQNCIYGVDIDPGAVEIAKLRLWLSLVVDEEDVKQIKPLPNLDYKVVVGNSLMGVEKNLFNQELFKQLEDLKPKFFDATDRKQKGKFKREINDLIHELTNGKEAFDFEIYFSEVFHRKTGFDVVIANPPFVGQSGNKDIFREVLATEFGKKYHQRRMDYFYFFFHKGLELARTNGSVCFISTNYYLTATYADKLRGHFKQSAAIASVTNFENAKIFESAMGQHNVITLLIKNGSKQTVADIAITKRQGFLNSEKLNSILFRRDSETLYGRASNETLFEGQQNYIRLLGNQSAEEKALNCVLSKIKLAGNPLVTLAEIVQGIVTGANHASERQIEEYGLKSEIGDGIFVLTKEEVSNLELNNRESRFIKPWYKNSDIDRWVTSNQTAKRLIYVRADSEFDPVEIPNLVGHFKKFKLLLVNRNVRTGTITLSEYDDFVRGKRDVPYVMIKSAFESGNYFCISYARDERVFLGEKIVCPQLSPRNTFAFENREWFAASDAYFIKEIQANEIRLKYLLGILNSRLCYFWLYHKGQRKGETLQLFKGPLSEIPIKRIPLPEQKPVEKTVERILAAKAKDADADVSKLEREIDELVYALYGLTPEEIKIVEGTAK